MTLEQKVVSYSEHVSALMEKTAAVVDAEAQRARAVDEAVPAVVDSLIQAGCFSAPEGAKLAKVLRDPVRTLEVLKHVAETRPAKAASLGAPMPKAASARASENPYVGGHTTAKRASDEQLLRALGIT